MADENSRRSRVEPVFGWLAIRRDDDWPARLLRLASGLKADIDPGPFVRARSEVGVNPSAPRLDWLLANVPSEKHTGRRLEGTTYADCLIECGRGVIWIEGKRHDWLSPGTTWDENRDQLARNLEGAWLLMRELEKEEFCVLLCHETDLRPEEQALVDGYRSGELVAGLPHVEEEVRRLFADRIGTVTWSRIVAEWPGMRDDPRLASVG